MQLLSTPINEEDLVKTLTEHAHKIATTVLDQPGTGVDLGWDAQVHVTLLGLFTPSVW